MAFLLIAATTWLAVLLLAVALCRAAAVGDLAGEAAAAPEDRFVAAVLELDDAPAEAPRAPAPPRVPS